MIASPSPKETLTTRDSRIFVVVWSFLASVALLIAIATFAAPVAVALGHGRFSEVIYHAFSYLCHQLPERSFHLAGHQLAVCSRCTGLYAGFAFATLGLPLLRPLKRTNTPPVIWLLLSAVPLAIDFGLTYFEIWQNNHFTRATTGALFGAVAAIYVVPGLIELSAKLNRRPKPEPPAAAG